MGVSKVDFAGNTLVDLTGDSVTPDTLLEGATAHNAAGDQIDGAVAVAPASNTTPKAPGTASAGSESAMPEGIMYTRRSYRMSLLRTMENSCVWSTARGRLRRLQTRMEVASDG